MPPTRRIGSLVESCLLPDHMLERNSKARVVEHGLLSLGHRRQPAGRVGELADVVMRHALVGFRLVVVRGRMMSRSHVEERIKQTGKVAAQEQGGDTGLIGLESQGDDVAHEPHVLADVFRQAVVRTRHCQGRAPAVLGAVVGLVFLDSRAADPLLDFPHACEILVELRLIGPADLAAQLAGMLLDPVEDALSRACSPGCRTGCRRPAKGTPPSGPARMRFARKCASYRPSRNCVS